MARTSFKDSDSVTWEKDVDGNLVAHAITEGSVPGGPAGGDLTGTYPNPTLAVNRVVANAPISGATKTKITYDTKGLVTAGADAQLASSDFANQGTTTTVLHGNAAGNPSFAAVGTNDISNDAVTYAKIQNVSATDKLLGRSSSGSGDVEEITCTSFARSILDDTDAAAVRATIGASAGSDVVSDTAYDATSWNGVTDIAPSKNAVRDKIESLGAGLISDTAFGSGWNGVTDVAPSKNAVYDEIVALISDTAYGSSWNGVTDVAPSKNAVYDKIETLSSGSGSLLAIIEYSPGSQTIKSTTSASFADVDSTNLVITFTAPSSGNVLVRLTAFCDQSDNSGKYSWALHDGTNQKGRSGCVTRDDDGCVVSYPIYVTSLTPGNSYTWKWQHATTSGTGRIIMSVTGTEFPAAVMEVWTAP